MGRGLARPHIYIYIYLYKRTEREWERDTPPGTFYMGVRFGPPLIYICIFFCMLHVYSIYILLNTLRIISYKLIYISIYYIRCQMQGIMYST